MGNGDKKKAVPVKAPKPAEEKGEYTIEAKVDKADLNIANMPNVTFIEFNEQSKDKPDIDVTKGSPLEAPAKPDMEFKLGTFSAYGMMFLIRYEGELPKNKNGTVNSKKVLKDPNIEIIEEIDFKSQVGKDAVKAYKDVGMMLDMHMKQDEIAAKAPEKKPVFSEENMDLEHGEFSMDIKEPESGKVVTVTGTYERTFGDKTMITMKTDDPAHAELFAKTIGQIAPAHDITKIAKLPMEPSKKKKMKY